MHQSTFVFTPRLRLYVFLCSVFIGALLVGDITGSKLASVSVFGFPFVISVGMVSFPVTFVLTDIINEFYGKQAARYITIVGFVVAAFAFLTIFVCVALPWAPVTRGADWKGVTEPVFNMVFAGSQRILLSSLVAYMAGQFTDIAVFHAIKRLTHERFLFLRATGSTLVSQLIDTVLIQFLVWWGTLKLGEIVSLAYRSYTVKLVAAVALTPVLYALHAVIAGKLHITPVPAENQEPTPDKTLVA